MTRAKRLCRLTMKFSHLNEKIIRVVSGTIKIHIGVSAMKYLCRQTGCLYLRDDTAVSHNKMSVSPQ